MIVIGPVARQLMNEDAVNAYPHECCGFLFGKEDGAGNRTVTEILPVDNSSTDNRRVRFAVSATDYMRAERHALDNDLLLLGVYHSHPDHPAEPSERDRVAAQPWFSYVIISVLAGAVKDTRSWVLNDQSQFEEEQCTDSISYTIKQ